MSFRRLAVVPIAIAVVLKGATKTSCFVPTPIHPCLNHQHAPVRFESVAVSPSCLKALVYGADGSVVGGDVFENPDDKGTDDNLLDALKTAVADSTVWNIIACAFAPPPHDKLTPELVQNANPIGVTENSIDIAVAVPASEQGVAAANQLVQILVTVSFPQPWALPKNAFHNAKVEALLGQVQALEGLAEDRLSQQRNSSFPSRDDPDYYEKMLIEQQWQKRLEEEVFSDSFPEWWTAIELPFSPLELREEAALLKKLLNEDEFEDELRALFVEHGKISGSSIVYRASVSSIGSSGLFLKARVATESDVKEKDKETEILASAAIPYSNPPKEVTTTGDLREGVLVLVESVTPMPMPDIAQAKPDSIESDDETITPFNEQIVEMVTERERQTSEMEDNESKDDEEETTEITEEDTEQEQEEDSAPEATIESETEATSSEDSSEPEKVRDTLSRQQPLPPEEEAKLAAKYAAIEDIGERAFTILRDLGMV